MGEAVCPNARSECKSDGAGGQDLGSCLLSEMSRRAQFFVGGGQVLKNNSELPEDPLVPDGNV